MDFRICSGQTDTHIEYRRLSSGNGDIRTIGLQAEVWLKFDRLRAAAMKSGIDLQIASGFRDFDRQLNIWNSKADGQRDVLDEHGMVIDKQSLSQTELVHAILRWSALPGASRHHWGTDLDVYDGAAIASDYQLQLTPAEYAPGGPFAKLDEWLTALEADDTDSNFGFFRPYRRDNGGIAPEAWHLSYAPIAVQCQRHWDTESLRKCIAVSDIALKRELTLELDRIFDRYVHVRADLYPSAFREELV